MEATHFIELVKYADGEYGQSGHLRPIEYLNDDLYMSLFCGHETVAVWRIKYTDVPLIERLAKRLGGSVGDSCSANYYQYAVSLKFRSK